MLLHISVVCSFLFLSGILLYKYTKICLSNQITRLGCFQCLALMNKATMNIHVYGHIF